MKLFLSFVIATFISIGLIPLLIRWAHHLGMIDEPDPRKVHQQAIPRCGGLGLAIATILTGITLIPWQHPYDALLPAGGIIILFGVLDDMYNLNYKWKFFGQFVAVIYVIVKGLYFETLPFFGIEPAPQWLGYLITFLFVVGATNAVNLSDGLDGLAAGIMLMSLAAIAYLASSVGVNNLSVMAIALAGGIFGFLRFNTHPALVFMGDTGSQFIGFMAAFLSIRLVEHIHQSLSPALPLLLLGLPVLDTLSVMTRRIAQGRSPFSPDKGHIHHRILALGISHGATVGIIYALQSLFLLAAFVLKYYADHWVVLAYVAISSTILLSIAALEQKGLAANAQGNERRQGYLRRFDWLFGFCRGYIEKALIVFVSAVGLRLLQTLDIDNQQSFYYIVLIAILGLLRREVLNLVSKLSVYIIGIYSCYLLTPKEFDGFPIDWVMNLYLVVLFLVVFLAIRITRRSRFSLNTQDVLITFFALSIILLSESGFVVDVLARLLCLGYAVEYLFNFDRNYRLLRFVSIVTGVLVLVRIFYSQV